MDPNQPTPNIPVQTTQQSYTPPSANPSHRFVFIIAGLIILFIGLLGGYYLMKSSSNPSPKACPLLAKLCPDGSSVSATGPNCEFAPCPQITINQPSPTPDLYTESSRSATANWKTYSNSKYNFSFKYPSEFKYLVENETFTNGDFQGVMILQNFPRSNKPNYSDNATFQMLIYSKKDEGEIIDQNKLTPVNGSMGAFIKIAKNGYIYLIDFTLNKTGNTGLFDQILSTFKFLNQESDNSVSQECEVCGESGIHNVNGAVCASGLVCKRGLITSLSYCVKQDATVETCEKSQ